MSRSTSPREDQTRGDWNAWTRQTRELRLIGSARALNLMAGARPMLFGRAYLDVARVATNPGQATSPNTMSLIPRAEPARRRRQKGDRGRSGTHVRARCEASSEDVSPPLSLPDSRRALEGLNVHSLETRWALKFGTSRRVDGCLSRSTLQTARSAHSVPKKAPSLPGAPTGLQSSSSSSDASADAPSPSFLACLRSSSVRSFILSISTSQPSFSMISVYESRYVDSRLMSSMTMS